jgi:hypothetical protein
MISPNSNNLYGFNPASNTFQQPLFQWKAGMFYQRYPIRQKNGLIQNEIQTNNLYRSLPLKIYRNELGGNSVGGVGATTAPALIGNLLERPAGFTFSTTNPSINSADELKQQTVVNSKDIIDGNSTNTVDRKCRSFSSKFSNSVLVHSRTCDSQCQCKTAGQNLTRCLTTSKSHTKQPYINIVKKTDCFSTAGNALTRVRNRGMYNCGGGSGNVGYRPQYSPTKNVDSLVVVINNY